MVQVSYGEVVSAGSIEVKISTRAQCHLAVPVCEDHEQCQYGRVHDWDVGEDIFAHYYLADILQDWAKKCRAYSLPIPP